MTDLLLTLALAAHLMMVNLAISGPIYAIWLERRGRRLGDEMPGELGQRLAKSSWHALLGAILLGLVAALVLHIPGEEWFQELFQLPRGRVHWGAVELLFSLVLMIIYSLAWKRMAGRPWLHRTLAILAATNLAYHFPMFFVIFSKLRDSGQLENPVTAEEFRQLIFNGEVVARSLHYVLASVAMTGVMVMLMALRRYQQEEDETAPPQRLAIISARAALVATLLQLPVGYWVLMEAAPGDREKIMGGDWWAGGLMLAGILSAVMVLHTLAAVSLGESERKRIRAAAAWMLLTILLMVGLLVRLRQPGPLREEEHQEAAAATRIMQENVSQVHSAAVLTSDERKTRWEWRQFALPKQQRAQLPRSHRPWA